MRASIIKTRDIYRGWMDLLVATLRMPDGKPAERHVMINQRAVAVLPFDSERCAALVVSQPRAAVLYSGEPEMLEAVAGGLDGEDPGDCARREALEEAGVRLGALEHVGRVWPMPSNSTEQLDLYLAPYSAGDRVGCGGGLADEQEHITAHELALSELWRMVEDRTLRDAKLLLLLQALRIRQPELFNAAPSQAVSRQASQATR